jgi:hypothetical protein
VATAGHREPCDSRGSCTVLGAPRGEIPSGDSTKRALACFTSVNFAIHGGRRQARAAPPLSGTSGVPPDPAHTVAAPTYRTDSYPSLGGPFDGSKLPFVRKRRITLKAFVFSYLAQ